MKRGIELNRAVIPLVIFILLFCLVPVHATIPFDTSSYELERYMSSEEIFFLRKAYPYEYKALHYQEYFTGEQTKPNADEQILTSSSTVPSSVGLSGPMNSSWPMKSYNAQRIGRTTSNTNNNSGIEKWRFKTFGAGGVDSGAVVADDGNIYFGCKDFYVYALYPNGTFRWRYKTGQPIWSTPAIDVDGTIYITSCDHYLYALHPNGNLKWKFNTGEIISSSPVIAPNGTIYIGHSQGRVFAIKPNGTELWHYDCDNDIYGDPALGMDGTIYIGSWDNRLYALNPNGTLKWRFSTGNHIKGVPSVASDGTIYFGSWDGYLYALYPNGTMRWRCNVGSGTETTPAISADGTIYVGGDELYAVYPNGTMRWSFYLGSSDRHIFMSCPAISTDGTIYVGIDIGNYAGEILAVNPDGTECWRKQICDDWEDSSPAIAADGTVYIGSTGGYYGNGLHAFGAIESNAPPNPPIIEGSTEGNAGTEYVYKLLSNDPDNNPVQFFIDWGDGKTDGWSYEQASGQRIWLYHTWEKEGTYIIKAKAQDVLGLESNWSTIEVTMPISYEPPHFRFIEWLLERFPNAFPILRYLLDFN
jgi:outer membrane protein assembly factor BamB